MRDGKGVTVLGCEFVRIIDQGTDNGIYLQKNAQLELTKSTNTHPKKCSPII